MGSSLCAAEYRDPIARVEQRLRSGEVQLKFQQTGGRGYLDSVLDALGIPPSSQTLVFSKTSAQFRLISPANPRALYFNDDVYVGWVPGGPFLEVSAATTDGRAVFYTLPQNPNAAPSFQLDVQGSCLQCHDSGRTDGVPGHMLRSVYPDPEGMPYFGQGTVDVRPSTPLAERWGGWYVTGKTRGVHRGNAVIATENRIAELDKGPGVDVTDLTGRFNVGRYLTPHSDVVAHLVLTHQVRMHNAIALAVREARNALAYRDEARERFGGELSEAMLASVQRRIERPAENLVRELLFLDEAPLSGPVTGTSTYAEDFAAIGPRDRQGRSLRDLDLNTQLLKYPCSWLIYSDAFDGLPEETKDYVYRRLDELLVGEDGEAIREILLATKREDAAALR